MSIYRNNSIKAFIQALDSQSSLISTSDWYELQQLASQLPEDDEKISEILENWLQSESDTQILEAYKQNLKSISAAFPINEDIIGIANCTSKTLPNQPSESSKELIENVIKKNSPLSDNTKTNQKS